MYYFYYLASACFGIVAILGKLTKPAADDNTKTLPEDDNAEICTC